MSRISIIVYVEPPKLAVADARDVLATVYFVHSKLNDVVLIQLVFARHSFNSSNDVDQISEVNDRVAVSTVVQQDATDVVL